MTRPVDARTLRVMRATKTHDRSAVHWLLAAVVLVGACSSQTTSPSPDPSGTHTGPTPSAGTSAPTEPPSPSPGGPGATGAPTAGPPGPSADSATSEGKIAAAVADGRLDEPTALAYRVLAIWGDGRVPEEYRGEWTEDGAALEVARQRLETLPPDIQAMVLPYLVRPTDPRSAWARPGSASGGSDAPPAIARPTAAPGGTTAATTCSGDWTSVQVSPNIPVVVWGDCAGLGPDAVAHVEFVRGVVATLWQPMTALMGEPILDAGTLRPGELPEVRDSRLDIYIAGQSQQHGSRWIDPSVTAIACAGRAEPYVGSPGAQASSSYLIVNPLATGSAAGYESTIAHELFHSLQFAHNSTGVILGNQHFWFLEASAKWSEHWFVPAGRTDQVHPWFDTFQDSGLGLSDNSGNNEYASYPWPMFMQQEAASHELSIAEAWTALEGKKGFPELQAAVDGRLPFREHFRDFAVRSWNEELLPGDPLAPRFQAVDPSLPDFLPGDARIGMEGTFDAIDPAADPIVIHPSIPSLRPEYEVLGVGERVKRITIDTSGLDPPDAVDVDALLEIKSKGWERRELEPGETHLCLDHEKDDVLQLILVVSNHDPDPATVVGGELTIRPLASSCGDLVGSITIHREARTTSTDGPRQTASEDLDATLHVNIESDPDPLGGGGYIDIDSTFTVTRAFGTDKQLGDCTARIATRSDGTWAFKDRPVGPEWENGIGGFMDVASGIVLLSVVAHYPQEYIEDTCDVSESRELSVHDVFGCSSTFNDAGLEGSIVEGQDGSPDRIEFDCRSEGPGLGWDRVTVTVTGSLTVTSDED
jgi:hypothetical protein